MLNRSAIRPHFRRGLCLAALTLLAALHGRVSAGELTITFIGNESFHITDGATTLLSDFPYRSGYFGYMSYDPAAVPPVVDGLSLITHFHADHFDRGLFEQQDWSIVAPPGVLQGLTTQRKITAADPSVIRFKDVTIQPSATPHRFAPEHYSYLVTWHGKRLYFVGDTETPAYILPLKDIDVLFITPWLIRTIARQELSLDADTLVVYHQKTDEEIPPFQDYRRMKQGESFTLGYDDATPALEPALAVALPTPVPAPADTSGPQRKPAPESAAAPAEAAVPGHAEVPATNAVQAPVEPTGTAAAAVDRSPGVLGVATVEGEAGVATLPRNFGF